MLELFDLAFMQRALIAGVIIGALCAIIGVYVVLKGLSFVGAGISHASFGGVAIGVALNVNPIWSAIVFCLFTAWGIGLVSKRGNLKADAAVGIFFSSTMALGVLIIGLANSYQVDLFGYLFGSILSVTAEDLWTTVAVCAIVLGSIALFYKDLMFVAFDSEGAEISGLPADKLYFLLITLIALTIVTSLKVVGSVLVSALIVTPAAAAYQLTDTFKGMMIVSVIFGVGFSAGGLIASYWLNVAPGALIVLLSTANYFICAAISPKRRRLKKQQTES